MADNKRRENINNQLVRKFYPEEELFEHHARDNIPGENIFIDQKLPYTKTGNLAHTLALKKKVPIMLTINSTNSLFKQNGIVNGQRGYIDHLEFENKDNQTRLKVIWVIFPDKETGKLLRETMRRKGIRNTNELAVPITEVKQTFQIRGTNIKATRTQFPMVLCFCMTSYKSQGQTLMAVILDYKDSIPKHGQFYVGMTRIRSAEGLFVRNFEPSQVLCRNDVKKELSILKNTRQYIMYRTYLDEKIWKDDVHEIKIGYQNIDGLLEKIADLDSDINLSHLDFLCLGQTKLTHDISDDRVNEKLQNFEIVSTDRERTDMVILKNKWTDRFNNYVISTVLQPGKTHGLQLKIDGQVSVIFSHFNGTIATHDIVDICKHMTHTNFMIADYNLKANCEEEKEKIRMLTRNSKLSAEINEEDQNIPSPLIMSEANKKDSFLSFCFRNIYCDNPTVGLRYCHGGVLSDEYVSLQIRKQDKDFLRKITTSELHTINSKTERQENDGNKNDQNNEKIVIDDESKVSRTEYNNSNDEIVVSNPAAIVKESSLRRLPNHDWLDDEIINCYMFQLEQKFKSFIRFHSFFHSELQTKGLHKMKKQYEKKNLFEGKNLFIPVNYKNLHWFLIVVNTNNITNSEISINVYDSNGNAKVQTRGIAVKKLELFFNWKYQQFCKDKTSKVKLTLQNMAEHIPRQENGYDCGVFLLMYSKYLAAGKPFTFTQRDMPNIRLKIRSEIVNKEIDDEFDIGEDHVHLNEQLLRGTRRKNIYLAKKNENATCASTTSNAYHLRPRQNRQIADAPKKEAIGQNLDHHHILLLANNSGKNLCFSNAVTTSLLNMKPIREALTQFNPNSEISNQTLDIWRELNKLANLPKYKQTTTILLRSIVKQRCENLKLATEDFDNDHQHDVAEFMNCIFQLLFSANDSTFNLRTQLFGGLIRKIMFCECGYKDELSVERLPEIWQIPVAGVTLNTCLKQYFEPEEIDRRCPRCNKDKALQITELISNPKNLILQLLRFKARVRMNNDNTRSIVHYKNDDEILFENKLSIEGVDYKLSWVICHKGNETKSGHYVCYLPNEEENSFTEIDDDTIRYPKLTDKMLKEAYVFGYEASLMDIKY